MSDLVGGGNGEFPEGIAIIGMSGRFPGARNLDEFWRNLRDGVESVSFFSDEQLKAAGIDPAVRRDPAYVGAGGVLDDIDLFDASFFGFNPREAEAMDPQQRLFLECAWETIENAGYDPARYPGSIGVYAGTGFSTYFFNVYQNADLVKLLGGHQIMIGNDKDHLATHVSYKFNLRGPSITVQTACSTSLVAVCVACRSLLDYQCDMALAGGSSVAVPQSRGYVYSKGGIASPDGHCRPFDAAACGTVAGNGVGLVLLKRYPDAVADGDHIRAVIRGTAVNNDGAMKVGYTAPSIDGQAEVIAMAQAVAGVSPETITFIEAHGTGTSLGDPIEIAALAQVFNSVKSRNHCAVGSLKSNVGHMDTAAGVGGLIKTVLALENRTIPPSLHFRQPNPKLNLERTPFYINSRLVNWHSHGPRRAGVSSFAIGGTNAHVVLEETPPQAASDTSPRAQLMLLSAPTATGLDSQAQLYAGYFGVRQNVEIADAAYTAALGRKVFRYRMAVVCRDAQEAAALLEQRPANRVVSGVAEPGHRPVVFLFSGQGSQYPGMAAGLYRDVPEFRNALDSCLNLLELQSQLNLRPALFPAANDVAEAASQLAQTALTQPALFAVEYALARTLMAWGIRPAYTIGHSVGEYVAACIAGVFSLEDALRLVTLRGRLMQTMPPGAMLAVSAEEGLVSGMLNGDLSLAAVNGPAQCVISGPVKAVEGALADLRGKGIAAVRLNTSHAFHSSMMEPILPAFLEAVRRAKPQPPSIPVVSNVTGDWLTASDAVDPQYWARHLRRPVRFGAGLERILQEPGSVLVEIGPGQTLAGLARQLSAGTAERVVVTALRRTADATDDYEYLLQMLGKLWVAGMEPDWRGFYTRERRSRVPLPTYPFERKRYWIDPPAQTAAPPVAVARSSRNPEISEWFYLPSWKSSEIPDGSGTPRKRNWLVFSDDDAGPALADALRQRGDAVAIVRMGEEFDAVSRDNFVLRPDCGPHYAALMDHLSGAGRLPDAVMHCWSLPQAIGREAALCHGFHSLLHLARSLAASDPHHEVTINVISSGVHAVLAQDLMEPVKATLQGPCTVIPQEYPALRCRNIDLTLEGWPAALDGVLEDCATLVTDPTIAYRGGRRWVRCFEPAGWADEPKAGSLLRPAGVYVITGGFGNIGITLAETLARRCRARLALLTRAALPERQDWDEWQRAHRPEELVSQRIRSILQLEALGAQVLPITCDVTSRDQIAGALERTRQAFGEIQGIIHAAGEMEGRAFRPISQTDGTAAGLHFGPKMIGAEILGEMAEQFKPAFCMMISSLASVLGGLNFSAYAAANSFLDAFAEHQNQVQRETRWISVNWDGWRFEEGTGSRAELFLTPTEGADVFRRILARRNASRVVISTGDLAARMDRWVRLQLASLQSANPDAPAAHERPELKTAYVKPRNTVEQMVSDVWQAILGMGAVGIHDNFFELGGHSLLAIQLVSRLRDLFQADIGLTALFEYPTVADLAAHIDGMLENAEGQMEDLARMLDYVEQLSPDEVKELLSGQQRDW
jgi:acyl transferase domain-containing protein/acyl carrier protein